MSVAGESLHRSTVFDKQFLTFPCVQLLWLTFWNQSIVRKRQRSVTLDRRLSPLLRREGGAQLIQLIPCRMKFFFVL